MKQMLFVVTLLFASTAFAQETAKLTEKEKLDLRQAQVEFLQAQANLNATPAYSAFLKSQAALNQAVAKVYGDHKIADKDYALCDGPSADEASPCHGVPEKELALARKKAPKEEAKK